MAHGAAGGAGFGLASRTCLVFEEKWKGLTDSVCNDTQRPSSQSSELPSLLLDSWPFLAYPTALSARTILLDDAYSYLAYIFCFHLGFSGAGTLILQLYYKLHTALCALARPLA